MDDFIERYDILQITTSSKDGSEAVTKERVLYISDDDDLVVTIDMESKTGCHYQWRKMSDLILKIQNKQAIKLPEEFDRSIEISWANKRARELMLKQLKKQEDSGMIISETDAQRLYNKRMTALEKAYSIVQEVVPFEKEPDCYRKRVNADDIKKVAEKYMVSTKTVYSYVRRYLQGRRSKEALFTYVYSGNQIKNKNIQYKLGRPSDLDILNKEVGGVIIMKDMEQLFSFAINHKYETRQRPSLKKTYDWMVEKFLKKQNHLSKEITKGVAPVPTLRQFTYWYKSKYENLTDQLISREGITKYANDYRAKKGDVWSEVSVPGQWYEIDATVADVYLINRINGEIIVNRPCIYVCVDVYTGMITGLSITNEAPSINAALSLIYNTIENKVDYCKRVAGLQIKEEEWPAQGIPNSITGDRGEVASPKFEEVIHGLGSTIKNVPPCLGSAKGVVEQCFNTLNIDVIHDLPGHIESEYRKRREPDYRLDAVLDIEEFTRIIIRTILHRNKKILVNRKRTPDMIKKNVQATPIDLWNYGLKKRSLMKNFSTRELIMKLMRGAKASITEKGIYFSKAYYGCDDPELENLKVEAANRGRITIDIRYDDRDISKIFWVRHDKEKIQECYLLASYQEHEIFNQRSYEEVREYEEAERDNRKSQSHEQLENMIEKNSANEREVEAAKKRQRTATPKVKNIKQEKQIIKDENKSQQALWKNLHSDKKTADNNNKITRNQQQVQAECVKKPQKGLLADLSRLLDEEET